MLKLILIGLLNLIALNFFAQTIQANYMSQDITKSKTVNSKAIFHFNDNNNNRVYIERLVSQNPKFKSEDSTFEYSRIYSIDSVVRKYHDNPSESSICKWYYLKPEDKVVSGIYDGERAIVIVPESDLSKKIYYYIIYSEINVEFQLYFF